MKKFSLLSCFFMVLFTVSFATAAYAEINVTGDKPIYPAVYQAIINGYKTVWGESKIVPITDPNTVIIEHVRTNDLVNIADFTLRISLENNVVKYQFSNIKTRTQLGKTWTDRSDFAAKNSVEKSFTDFFDAEIPKVMGNETLYAQVKQAADKNNWAPRAGGAAAASELAYSLPLQNPQNFLLYPAVGAAFTNLTGILGAKTANLWDIDCLDNQFTIRGCVAERKAFDMITYYIKLSYKDNQLTVEFTNIDIIGDKIMQYSDKELNSMSKFDTKKIADQLKAQIEQSLANAAVYNSAKKAFLENNNFLSRAFVSVTKILMDEFITTLFKDGEISFSATISDVRKNENADFKNYSTEVRASLYTEPYSSGAFAYISLYTNDAGLTRLKPNEKIKLSGQFVRLEETAITKRFIMTK